MACIYTPGERRALNALADPDGCGNHPAMCGRYASFLPAEAMARIFAR
jgi:hypothetical protein